MKSNQSRAPYGGRQHGKDSRHTTSRVCLASDGSSGSSDGRSTIAENEGLKAAFESVREWQLVADRDSSSDETHLAALLDNLEECSWLGVGAALGFALILLEDFAADVVTREEITCAAPWMVDWSNGLVATGDELVDLLIADVRHDLDEPNIMALLGPWGVETIQLGLTTVSNAFRGNIGVLHNLRELATPVKGSLMVLLNASQVIAGMITGAIEDDKLEVSDVVSRVAYRNTVDEVTGAIMHACVNDGNDLEYSK